MPIGSKRTNWVLHYFRLIGLMPIYEDPHRTQDIWDTFFSDKKKGQKDTVTPLRERCAKKVILHPVSSLFVIPKDWVWASFRQGGKEVKFDGKAKFTSATNATRLPAFLRLKGKYFRFTPAPTPAGWPTPWEPDLKQGLLKNSMGKGQPCPIVRPLFPESWVVDGFADLDVNYTSFEKICDILMEAGRLGGFGPFRPNCGGDYGTYEVDELRPAKLEEWEEYNRLLNTAPLAEATA
ncbi:MAG: hypothetical protein V1895_00505 [Parcubacteria group bacterium]